VINEPTELRDLLDRARRGDAEAFALLFARHRERLRQAVALRLDHRLTTRVDVSDVLQDAYLEVMRRLPEYLRSGEMPFDLWLMWLTREQTLMTNRRHLADMRSVKREAPPLPVETSSVLVRALAGSEPSPSQAVAAAETAEKLRLALSQLDDDERDLILWRHFERLSNREVSQMLKVTESAAAKRYIRALERLRGLLVNLGVSGG
jgi:RNA polymerase sigma-70 factor (ECF subfamily)